MAREDIIAAILRQMGEGLDTGYRAVTGAADTALTAGRSMIPWAAGNIHATGELLKGKSQGEALRAGDEFTAKHFQPPLTEEGRRGIELLGEATRASIEPAQDKALQWGGAPMALAMAGLDVIPGNVAGKLGVAGKAGKASEASAAMKASERIVDALRRTKKLGAELSVEEAATLGAGKPKEYVAQLRKGLLDKASGVIEAEQAAKDPAAGTYIPWAKVSQGEASKLAAEGAHLTKEGGKGPYTGGPRDVKTMAKVLANREKAADTVMAGKEGFGWYPRERDWVEKVAPQGNKKLQADLIGINSPQAQPGPNLQWALGTSWQNQMDPLAEILANPPKRKQQAMQGAIAKDFPELPVGGQKVGAFAERLAEEPTGGMSVNDLWNARLLGYGPTWDKGLGPAMHNYSAGETNAVRNLVLEKHGPELAQMGITPEALDVNAIQAGGWVKGRIDNILKRPKDASKRITYEQLRALPDDDPYKMKVLKEANAGFSTYAPKHEFTPSAPQRLNEAGKDPLYDALGVPQQGGKPLIAYEKARIAKNKLSPSSERGTGLVEALRAYTEGGDVAGGSAPGRSMNPIVDTVGKQPAHIPTQDWSAGWKEPQGSGTQTARLAEMLRAEPKALEQLGGSEALQSHFGAMTPGEGRGGAPDVGRARSLLSQPGGLSQIAGMSKADAAKLGLPALLPLLYADQLRNPQE